jgi:hypothetical protein
MQKQSNLPISYTISVARLPQKGMPVRLTASETERAALTVGHDLQAVKSFHADLLVTKWRRDGVRITGVVTSLEPLPACIESQVDAMFVPESSKLARPKVDENGEMLLDAEGPDAPETFSGDQLDVGVIAEEFFALAIDPYPRKQGAVLELTAQLEDVIPLKVSAFAKLAVLKQKQ